MTLSPSADIKDLIALSARIGADPMLIQAAGGNTSVKDGAVMWIKASGTQLADAVAKDIFVPVDLPAMRDALADPGQDADQTQRFALGDTGLRPSIETSLHAVFHQRVVVHVHCVNTLAHAVQAEAKALLAPKLADFAWALVPYVKPGANLAALVQAHRSPETDVVVLANHGLIVAADNVAEAEALLARVVAALSLPTTRATPDLDALARLATPDWTVPPGDAAIHQVALDPDRLAQATGGSLYPDHVIFCGIGALSAETPPTDPEPPFVLISGKGALMRKSASASAEALMNCLGDVLMRVPATAQLAYLTLEQNAELLNWDAEKYRQALNA